MGKSRNVKWYDREDSFGQSKTANKSRRFEERRRKQRSKSVNNRFRELETDDYDNEKRN